MRLVGASKAVFKAVTRCQARKAFDFANIAHRTLTNTAGSSNAQLGVSRSTFAVGVTSAALVGYGIGIVAPAFLMDGSNTNGTTNRIGRHTSTGPHHSKLKDITHNEMAEVFDLESPLAHGGTATVWRAVERATGRRVAVKVVDKSLVNTARINAEVDALELCADNPHVMRLLCAYDVDAYEASPSGEWRLVTELAEGGELLTWAQQHPRYTEKEAAYLMRQATEALAHMHEQRLVHRDVKPENLVLMSTEKDAPLKLIDVRRQGHRQSE